MGRCTAPRRLLGKAGGPERRSAHRPRERDARRGRPGRAQGRPEGLHRGQAGRCHRARRGPIRVQVHALARRGQRDDSRPREPDKTILSFKDQGQGTGGEGLLISSKKDITLENFAVEDARGDGIKSNGTNKIAFRKIRAEWTGGPKETNGGYGIYPVNSKGVVIEDCTVMGASDAGIYVGQSQDIVVRRNKVEKNVAGIEIENSTRADVYENEATDNSGGILVFTMPDLPVKDGRLCRVYHNKVIANNHDNFAPKGNIVATVPPGTGVMIMANDQVEVFDNTIEQNQTGGLSIISYLMTDKPLSDPGYDPFCEAIHIHDNRFASNGGKPSGAIGEMLSKALGSPLPDILYDGIIDPKKQVDGKLPEALAIHIKDNGKATAFANFDAMGSESRGRGKGQAAHHRARSQGLSRGPAGAFAGLD